MKVIEVQTPNDQTVYIEVDDQAVAVINPQQPPGGGTPIGLGEKAQSMMDEMEKIGEVIAQVCGAVEAKVKDALDAAMPAELSIEFGVKLAGEAGVPLVTKGTVEGAFKVTAKWNFSAKSNPATGTNNAATPVANP